MLFLLCRSIGDFEHYDWSIFKNHWRHFRGKCIKVVVLLTTFLTLPLHPLPHCLSPSFLAFLPLHPPPHYLSPSFLPILLLTTSPLLPLLLLSRLALLFLLPLPSFLFYFSPALLSSSYYLYPFFFSLLLTASLPPSSQSSSLLLHPHSSPSTFSLPLSLLPLHPPPHYLSLSPSLSFFSILLLTSSLSLLPLSSSSLPLSFLPLNPPHYYPCFLSLIPIHPPHYLSPSFLSVILTTCLPLSSQSSSPPLHPSFLSIRHLITSLLFPVILSSTSLPLSFFRLHPPY